MMFFNRKGACFWVKRSVVAAAVLILVLLSIWAAVKDVRAAIQIARPPSFLDPAKISTFEEKLVCGALYETLLSYDAASGCSKGALAEKWKVDTAGRVYTFSLRKGARFHNGKAVTAKDVKYSWERVLDPKTSSYGYLLRNVQGSEDFVKAKSCQVQGLKVINDHTLQVVLQEPDYTFPAVVSSPVLGVVNRDLVSKQGDDYGKVGTPVAGTGPFSLTSWTNKKITLSKNKRYIKGAPRLGGLDFLITNRQSEIKRLVQEGKVDILAGVTPQWANTYSQGEGKDKVVLVKKPVLALYFLGFNLNQTPFGDQVELRRGVNSMLNKEKMAMFLLGEGCKPLDGFLPSELLSSRIKTLEKHVPDREAALTSLASAGYPYGSRLQPLTLAYNDSTGHELLARLVQEELGQVGIAIELKKSPWQEYKDNLLSGHYPFFRLGWEADYPEPGNLLSCNFESREKQNHNLTGYSNEKFDSLLKAARGEPDFMRRQEIYRQAEDLIISDLPVIPLFQRVAVIVIQKEIKGFQVDLLGTIDFSCLDKVPKSQN